MTGSIESVKRSLAYRNVKAAMDVVFGIDAWAVNTIWPGVNANDFWLSVDVGGQSKNAYVSVCNTHTKGMYSHGPGGNFDVYIPVDHATFYTLPDGRSREEILDFAATPDEQRAFSWGAMGNDVLHIAAYLRILKRCLDGVPTSSVTDPNSEHVSSFACIGAPTMTENLANALDSAAGKWDAVNDIVRINNQRQYWIYMSLDKMSRVGYFRLTRPGQEEGGNGMCLVCAPARDGGVVFPDEVQGGDVAVLAGTPEERRRLEGGVDGGDVDGMRLYVELLERYVYSHAFEEGWKQLVYQP